MVKRWQSPGKTTKTWQKRWINNLNLETSDILVGWKSWLWLLMAMGNMEVSQWKHPGETWLTNPLSMENCSLSDKITRGYDLDWKPWPGMDVILIMIIKRGFEIVWPVVLNHSRIHSAYAQITYVHHIKSKLVIFWMVIPLKYGIITYIPPKKTGKS